MDVFRKLKVLIASRRLFDNWLSAGIKYYLVKRGVVRGDIVVKCNGRRYVLSPWVYSFIVVAYYDGLLRDPLCGDSGFLGKLGGIIDLVIRNNGVFFKNA